MENSEHLREKLPWFPKIDYSICLSDLKCLNFCPAEVFEWDRNSGRPVVAHPYRCVPGCDSCAQLCHEKAISFPSKEEFRQAMRRLRADARNASASPGISS
ncbi:MAG TPA: ferredoxin family protein [Terriglobia bacterium]|nr:ferredoxin family protein [Terriglobia bacterium]